MRQEEREAAWAKYTPEQRLMLERSLSALGEVLFEAGDKTIGAMQPPHSRKCPYCAEEVQRLAMVCVHCGRTIVPTEWKKACERWRVMPRRQRLKAWPRLTDEQRHTFEDAWKALSYDIVEGEEPTICKHCGTVGMATWVKPGSAFIEAVLWVLFLFCLLGLLYSPDRCNS
jgi:hypothetical protein